MSASDVRLQQLLAANAEFAKSWPTPPKMEQMRKGEEATLCLTCMDPRVVPEQFLGPNPMIGVFRNAGGRYSADAVRTIAVLRSLLPHSDKTTIMVVHHTDCGMTHLTDDEVRHDIEKRGLGKSSDLSGIDFGCFTAEDLEKTIRKDIAAFEAEEILKGVQFKGYVLVTETGLLTEV